MSKKFKEFTIENTTYRIFKVGLKDTLEVGALLMKIGAAPIIPLVSQFLSGNDEDKNEALTEFQYLLNNPKELKENINGLLQDILDNVDNLILILNTVCQDATIKTTDEDGNCKEEKLEINDLDFDDIDIMIEIIINAFQLNFETGLKKVGKKFQFLASDKK